MINKPTLSIYIYFFLKLKLNKENKLTENKETTVQNSCTKSEVIEYKKSENNLFLILSGKTGKKVKIKSDLSTPKLEDILQWSNTKYENIS